MGGPLTMDPELRKENYLICDSSMSLVMDLDIIFG
jgi:hypothetical protein